MSEKTNNVYDSNEVVIEVKIKKWAYDAFKYAADKSNTSTAEVCSMVFDFLFTSFLDTVFDLSDKD